MYHRILDKSNTPSDTSEVKPTYPSEAHEWTFEKTTEIVICAQRYGQIIIRGGATGSHVTENDVTGSDVSHMTGSFCFWYCEDLFVFLNIKSVNIKIKNVSFIDGENWSTRRKPHTFRLLLLRRHSPRRPPPLPPPPPPPSSCLYSLILFYCK